MDVDGVGERSSRGMLNCCEYEDEERDSTGDIGRTDAAESESTSVGDVGDKSSSAGDGGRPVRFSLSLNEVKSCAMLSDLRRDSEGDRGLGEGGS